MIKYVQCIRRKPGLDITAFRQSWREYVQVIHRLAGEVGALRCTESLSLAVSQNLEIMLSRGTGEAFDAMLEISLESAASLGELSSSPAFKELVAEMHERQESFVDMSNSTFFFASEHVLVGS